MYTPLIINAITFLSLSKWSVIPAALFKNLGANDHISTILCREERGSKILIGNDIWAIVRPLNRLTVSCFKTSTSTPFYFSNASLSVQTRPPYSCSSNPFSISSFFVGSGLSSISSVKYTQGGAYGLYACLLSTYDLGGTDTVWESMYGLSTSSDSSTFSSSPTWIASVFTAAVVVVIAALSASENLISSCFTSS